MRMTVLLGFTLADYILDRIRGFRAKHTGRSPMAAGYVAYRDQTVVLDRAATRSICSATGAKLAPRSCERAPSGISTGFRDHEGLLFGRMPQATPRDAKLDS